MTTVSPPAAPASNTTPTATPGKGSIAGDFDRFLLLLTTQLQHQDPMSPMDATQFTTQLVQFSQVEQSVNMNQYQFGRPSCKDRVCQYDLISVVVGLVQSNTSISVPISIFPIF